MACCLCLKTYLDTELSYISSHSIASYDYKFSFMTLKSLSVNIFTWGPGSGILGELLAEIEYNVPYSNLFFLSTMLADETRCCGLALKITTIPRFTLDITKIEPMDLFRSLQKSRERYFTRWELLWMDGLPLERQTDTEVGYIKAATSRAEKWSQCRSTGRQLEAPKASEPLWDHRLKCQNLKQKETS